MIKKSEELKISGRTAEASKQRQAYYHSEILEFADWIQITDQEIKERYDLLDLIESLIKEHIPEAQVFMFGSTANRLALPGSDIDVLVCLDSVKDSPTYSLLFDCILNIILVS
jgi:DNA polymerase sigma